MTKETVGKSIDTNNHLCYINLAVCKTHGPVAQLDRVSDSDSEGRAFESRRVRQKKHLQNRRCFFVSEILGFGFEAECNQQSEKDSCRNTTSRGTQAAGESAKPSFFLNSLHGTLSQSMPKAC